MPLPALPAEGFEDQVRSLGRVVAVFTAGWCPFCRRFEAVVEAAAARHPQLRFALADISDDDADPRWDRYRIEVVPTVLLFVDGAEAARLGGILGRGLDARQLEAWLRGLPASLHA